MAACSPSADLGTAYRPLAAQLESAIFDPILRAPVCATLGAGCDTGTLVNGRGLLGPEPNTPNSLYGSCADGSSGTYHVDESLDRVRVYTIDGRELAPGKTVAIEALVWAYSSYSSDAADFFYTTDVNTPSWRFLTTLVPNKAGAQTLTAFYTLPADSTLQAVRVVFRYGSAAEPCVIGGYNDRDDLVFAVAGTPADVTPPTTAVISPVNGDRLAGLVTITAEALDDVGISRVEFYRGPRLLGTDTVAPYTMTWDTRSEISATYSLTTRAYDLAGNIGHSAAVNVTVESPERIANGGFEGSVEPWTLIGNASHVTTGSFSRSGTGHVHIYPAYSASGTVSQDVIVPANGGIFRYWISIGTNELVKAVDHFSVTIVGTQSWLTDSFSNLDYTDGYIQRTMDLSEFAGQTVRVVLYGHSDGLGGTYFRIDDVSIREVALE
jgi:hypothetical protein